MQKCLAGINQAQALMRDKLSAVPEDVTRVLVMGVTGAGKSMLVNALAGNARKVVTVNGTRVVEAVSQLPELKIGHTVQSETTWSDTCNLYQAEKRQKRAVNINFFHGT